MLPHYFGVLLLRSRAAGRVRRLQENGSEAA